MEKEKEKEKEKDIGRADMIETIGETIRTAALKSITAGQDITVEINPRTGQLKIWAIFEVVDSVYDPRNQMHKSKAMAIDGNLQTVRQEIMQ
jgi:N utilization substance protein A